MFQKKIVIDHSQVGNVDLENFPVLISVTDEMLKSVEGEIFFLLDDGETRAVCEIYSRDSEAGVLRAQVRVPRLLCSEDTVLYLCCGETTEGGLAQSVWDAGFCMVRMGEKRKKEEVLALKGELTVEAWVHCEDFRPEALQSIVSKWAPLESFGEFAAYDAGHTDGLRSEAYFGAVFDGRYVYFSPQHYEDYGAHGIVLRYDTQGDFKDSDSYAAYDAGHTAELNTRGFYGAIFDGRYVYFVPRQDAVEYHSRVLRYDTHMDFKDEDAWEVYDVGEAHSQQGVAFDGRYIYFSPGYEGNPKVEDRHSGRVIRFDTQASFKDASSWAVFDAVQVSELATCFDGAGFDGRYVYFAPLLHGVVLQYDTRRDFSDPASWRCYDAKPLEMEMCVGTVFDGRHMYFVPYGNATVVRFDTRGDFEDASCWESRDGSGTSGLNTSGFDGGFFDGKYVYFEPFVGPPLHTREDGRRGFTFHCNFLRYDPRKPFEDADSWDAYDSSRVDGLWTVGYNGGAFDGRFFYLAPWRDGTGSGGMHGRVLRYDTLGSQGSFDLRYCDYGHNGGLCAAVRGPAFLVNTTEGVLSVALHRVLTPGQHYLAGVYNGRSIKLFVDGVLVAERSGSGAVQENDVAVVIGSDEGGIGNLEGVTEEVRISNVARSDEWVKATYRNLVRPQGFVRVEEELEN